MDHPLDNMTEPELRALTNRVCTLIRDALPSDTGFCVLFFPTGAPGVSQYGANCRRADMIKALREAADRLEQHQDVTR